MKRAIVIILFIMIAMQAIQTEKVNEITPKDLEIKAPKEVMSILKRSCYDCHSNNTKWPWYSYVAPASWSVSSHVEVGRQWVNFSIWETYTKEEKKKKLKEIFRSVYAAMPISSYTYFHEEAKLTKEERGIIRDWTGVRR